MGWFYLGHGRVGLGRFSEALDPFQKALDLGLSDHKVRFQLGYSAHRAGRHDLAVPPLSAVLESEPDHPEARYWLGVSLVLLNRSAEAEAMLSPLAAGTGPWRFLALFHRALARRHLGRVEEARADLLILQQEADLPELRSKATELLEDPGGSPRITGTSSPLSFSFTGFLKSGYDSNVPLLADTSVGRGSGEGSAFLAAFVSGDLGLLQRGALVLRGSGLSQRFAEVPEADLIVLLGELESLWKWPEFLDFRASLHSEGSFLDDEFLFRRIGASGELTRSLWSGLSVAAGGLWMQRDFAEAEWDALDSHETGAHAGAVWEALPGFLEVRATYRYLTENAHEGDLDHQDHRLELRSTILPHPDGEILLEGWFARSDYAEANRVAPRPRRDLRAGVRASFSWTFAAGLRLFVEGDYERVNSTLKTFDFERTTVSGGLAINF